MYSYVLGLLRSLPPARRNEEPRVSRATNGRLVQPLFPLVSIDRLFGRIVTLPNTTDTYIDSRMANDAHHRSDSGVSWHIQSSRTLHCWQLSSSSSLCHGTGEQGTLLHSPSLLGCLPLTLFMVWTPSSGAPTRLSSFPSGAILVSRSTTTSILLLTSPFSDQNYYRSKHRSACLVHVCVHPSQASRLDEQRPNVF